MNRSRVKHVKILIPKRDILVQAATELGEAYRTRHGNLRAEQCWYGYHGAAPMPFQQLWKELWTCLAGLREEQGPSIFAWTAILWAGCSALCEEKERNLELYATKSAAYASTPVEFLRWWSWVSESWPQSQLGGSSQLGSGCCCPSKWPCRSLAIQISQVVVWRKIPPKTLKDSSS